MAKRNRNPASRQTPKLRRATTTKPVRKTTSAPVNVREDEVRLYPLEPRIMLDAAGGIALTEGLSESDVDNEITMIDAELDARSLQEYLQDKVADLDAALSQSTSLPALDDRQAHGDVSSGPSTTALAADPSLVTVSEVGDSTQIDGEGRLVFVDASDIRQNGGSADISRSVDGAIASVSLQADVSASLASGANGQGSDAGSDYSGDTANEIFFVDTGVDGYELIVDALPENAQIVLVDGNADGLQTIIDTLNGRSDIDGIHIFSHGDSGTLALGNIILTAESISGEYADELNLIGSFLSDDADILLYGCNFASGEIGSEAVSALALVTNADIATSTDFTGSAELDGNWLLESASGLIETNAISATSF